MTKIAFIGLGNMGAGMCANLVKAGFRVRAFDLDTGAVERAQAYGAVGAPSVAESVADADVVVTMLPAGQQVHAVYFGEGGVASCSASGTLFLDCSTISIEESRAAAQKAADAGFLMVDAPVSGGTAAANAGTLTFMVGGSREAFDRASPLLTVMGKNIFYAGGSGNGQAAKIANNMLLGISMIGTCEAFNLAERLGLDAQTFFDIASTASGQCWSMTSYCPLPGPVPAAPSNRKYAAGFAVGMMLKDLQLALHEAGASRTDTPLGRRTEEIYAQFTRDGYAGLDFSGVILRLRGDL